MSIIEELQRKIIDDQIPLSVILLQIKLTAGKLNLGVIQDWVSKESSGYVDAVDLPNYRILGGTPMAHNPLRGPMPIQGPAKMMQLISEIKVRQSIQEIEAMLQEEKSSFVSFTYPPGPREAIRNMLQFPFDVYINVSKSSISSIISYVRNVA